MQVKDISQRATPILKSYGVKKAALFGSFSRGEATDNSDIDILVELGQKMSLLDFVGLKQDLEQSLGKDVDLVQYKTIKPSLKKVVLVDEQVFFKA